MKRVLAIIQLCFAFTLILWVLAKPFTSDYFTTRSELLLFQTAMGKGNAFIPIDKLQRHADRFAKVDANHQQRIIEAYQRLERKIQTPFFTKLEQSCRGLLLDLPPFTQAWLLFSVVIAIMLLRASEGASHAAWLLPVITLCCAVDNIHRPVLPPSIDEVLLPSEQLLLMGRESEPWGEHRAALTQGWQRYLIEVWAGQIPSIDPEIFNLQVEAGEHALTMARIEKRLDAPPPAIDPSVEQTPWPFILLYLIWNSGFAVLVNNPRERYALQSSHSR